MRYILKFTLIAFLLMTSHLHAQDFFQIKGNVGNIHNVNIIIQGTSYGTTTNEQGYYELLLYKTEKLFSIHYSAIGYIDTIVQINPAKHTNDTITINITLRKADYLLPEVAIKGSTDFFKIKNESITDIGFLDHGIVLLTTTIRRKSIIRVIDYSGKALNEIDLDANYLSIHKDCFGNLELIGSDSCLQIYCDFSNASINIIDKFSTKDFYEKLEPCIISDNDFFLFKETNRIPNELFVDQFHNKKASYFSVMANDSNNSRRPFIEFFDKDAYKNAQSVYNEIISIYFKTTPENENVIALQVWNGNILKLINDDHKLFNLISWYQKIESRPINMNVFLKSDTLYFIDISEKKLLRYSKLLEMINEKSIAFNEKIELFSSLTFIQDEKTKIIYGAFVKNGMYKLGVFDVISGKILNLLEASKEPHPTVFRVFNGYSYCIYYDAEQRESRIKRNKLIYE